jgi:hypothetical protein
MITGRSRRIGTGIALALPEERIKNAIHYGERERTMRRLAVTTIGILMTMCAATAHADAVTDWNQIAIDNPEGRERRR